MGNGCGGDGKALRVARGIDINILYIHTTYIHANGGGLGTIIP